MKYILITVTAVFFSVCSIAQQAEKNKEDEKRVTKYFDKDQLVIELYSNLWLNAPSEINVHPRSLAFNVQLMYTLAGKHSNVALAGGLGLLTENYHIDAFPEKQAGELEFVPIDDELDYAINKIRFTTVEIPVEMRIRSNRNSRNKLWKVYIGGKAGYMFQSMHKYTGEDPEHPHESLKQKTFNIPYTDKFTYGPTLRFGYDQVMLSAYYNFSSHFKKNKAIDLYPFMVGLTLFIY